ncbi:hypothetical protein ACFXDJ_20315 [Streptomyces sp. NPDC059443]|uniref:hypothetical protein n=1 Tax=unclassified Streptomyces TaxID=2593676 RepID=UPI00367B0415
MAEEPLRESTRALVTATRMLLDEVAKEPIPAPEYLAGLLQPMAANLQQSLLNLRELCEALAEAAPESIHHAHLSHCAEELRTVAGHWASIKTNSACLGVV